MKSKEDFVFVKLQPCVHEVYLDVMNVNLDNTFINNFAGKRGAILLNYPKLKIPNNVISQMIEQVAKSVHSHTTFMLNQEEIIALDFVAMVGGFLNSPIVIQEVKNMFSIQNTEFRFVGSTRRNHICLET